MCVYGFVLLLIYSCWISNFNVFYGAFIAPMALSLVYNISILVIIINSLRKRKKQAISSKKKDSSGALYLLRVVVCLSMLLGLTWVFGILVVLNDHIALQYIFAILNTFQGFLIFILHMARAKDVRDEWTSLVKSKRKGSVTGTGTFSSTVRRTSTNRSGHTDTLRRFRNLVRRSSSAASTTTNGLRPMESTRAGNNSIVSLTTISPSTSKFASPRSSPPPGRARDTSIANKALEVYEAETSFYRSDSVPSFADYNVFDDVLFNPAVDRTEAAPPPPSRDPVVLVARF